MSPQNPARHTLTLDGRTYETGWTRKYAHRKPFVPKDPTRLNAIIPGLVLEVLVRPGEAVAPGQSLLIVEAMKMQNHVTCRTAGRVKAVHAAPGATVAKGQLLLEFEAAPDTL